VKVDPDGRDNFFIGGGGDKYSYLGVGPTNIMEGVKDVNQNLFQGQNHYFGYEDKAQITEMVKSSPGKHNLIGHSYGGAAAMDIAAGSPQGKIDNLVTLDPVSLFPKADPKNYNKWVNVHQEQTLADGIASIPLIGNVIAGAASALDTGGGNGDSIATLGGQLGAESGATNIPTTKPHADAAGMLDQAKPLLKNQ
jgi:pimeloyl-ACP methyl ester carboxylesterase